MSADGTLLLVIPDFSRDFVQVPNSWVRDPRLSRRARGLLAELMSFPTGYEIKLADLVETGPEGKDALNSAVRELQTIGYLTRRRLSDRYGMKGGYEWSIHSPEHVDNRRAENPLSVPSTAENPLSMRAENPLSKRTLNTSKSSSEGEYRSHAREALAALSSASIYLDQRCAHAMAGSGRACGGRVLRDQPRWCEFGHEQLVRADA